MHLHPEWQQYIVSDLLRAFPKIQWVVTTHSPQVLSTVPSHAIRILDNYQVVYAPSGVEGAESSRVLQRVLNVNPRPQNNPVSQKLDQYLNLVYQDKWASKEALTLRSELDKSFANEEPELTRADLHIENRTWELEHEENQ